MIPARPGTGTGTDRYRRGSVVFVFFSNRLGCFGSLVVTLVGTAILVGLLYLSNVL